MLLVCCYTFLSLFFPPSILFAIHTHSNDACRLPTPPLTLLNPTGAFLSCLFSSFFFKEFSSTHARVYDWFRNRYAHTPAPHPVNSPI